MEMEYKYFTSIAYGEFCKRVFGSDMKQAGLITKDELELLFQSVSLSPNSNILDIGCGAGYITAAIAENYKSITTGIDIHAGSIKHANKTFSENSLLSFQVMDAHTMSYDTNSFDLICFFDTLYFEAEKIHALLDKCMRVLKPNGKIAIFWVNQTKAYEEIDTFFMSEPTPNHTQVGLWCSRNKVTFKTFNLTEAHRKVWIKGLTEYKNMECELAKEMPKEYPLCVGEFTTIANLCKKGDEGGIFRWLYILEK